MTEYLENGYYCNCGEWVSYGQLHQCSWGGWLPIKTAETCPHCGGIIEKWLDPNQKEVNNETSRGISE